MVFTTTPEQWLPVNEAAKRLGISSTTLRRRKADGLLKPGIHYIRAGLGKTSRMLWNVIAILKEMMRWTTN
jgi:hypothetical protein